ncbi:MAG: glycosyltransferase [Candidatus Kaiserbacteria bacterium]|nr:glycosyltransferase [Candidatus Kaiserbacteria bacterium]
MRVLQIGADRSKRGILFPGSPAYMRQKAYAENFGALDIIGCSLKKDGAAPSRSGNLAVYPTNAPFKLFYGTYALMIARTLEKPDVVSAQDPHSCGLLALWIARWRGVPLHIQVHTDIFAISYGLHSVANSLKLHIAFYVLKKADGIRVVSERVKEHIEARLTPKRPIKVLPIFTDIERLRSQSADPTFANRFSSFTIKLLFVGRLEPEKNCAAAIRAFAEAAPRDACLIVVGTGHDREALEALAREKDVADRVFFEGEKDAAPYYALIDLLLVTSVYEGYGMAIVEALGARKPVLSTDVGIAREAGAIIAEGDFAEALGAWFKSGPRHAALASYPYKTFDEYVAAYCDDIRGIV